MALPTHSNGEPGLPTQDAVGIIQSTVDQPQSQNTQTVGKSLSSGAGPPAELPFPIAERAHDPQPYHPNSLLLSIINLLSTAHSAPAVKPHSPPAEIVETIFLPSELLHTIFAFALEPSSADIDLGEKITLRTTIFSCAQVCQQWRFAARDCPEAWPNAIDFQRQPSQVIADVLRLSRPHPIDIGHRAAPWCVANERDLVVLDLLKPESRRIREWNVEFPHASDEFGSHRRWAFPCTDQPLVTSLRYKGGFTSPLWELRSISPTLKKLSILDGRTFRRMHYTVPFPVLTELRISNLSPHFRPRELEWLNILRNMPHLQFLALHSVIRPDANGFPPPDLVLPELRFLSLQCDDWEGARGAKKLFQWLQVPASCGMELGFPSSSTYGGLQTHLESHLSWYKTRLRGRISGGFANLTFADVPQIEIGLRSTPKGCDLSFGTTRDADLTLNWNGEHGTRGAIEYLDVHTNMFPKFPSLNIIFTNATTADFSHAFGMTRKMFWRARSVKIHVDEGPSSNPSVGLAATALPSILSQIPWINVLKLGRGSSRVLRGLRILLPSPTGPPLSTAPSTADPSTSAIALLPQLQHVVLEMGDDTEGRDEGTCAEAMLSNVQEYADWRKSCNFPITVTIR